MAFSEKQNEILKPVENAPHPDPFVRRHIGPRPADAGEMLKQLGYASLDAMIDDAVPKPIRLARPLQLPAARSEQEVLNALKKIAAQNQVFRSYIGMGYYDCITPAVIQRNVLENPGWYTQYTPYQAEISQGRLEALLNFQTMVADLTGLDIANASLLDEATAAAEAMTMCHALKDGRNIFFILQSCHPQNIEVVRTRAKALGIEVVVGDHESFKFNNKVFGALVQYPDTFGAIHDCAPFVEKAHVAGAMVTVATDLLALTLLKPPGGFSADIAIGSAQRFGVPLGYGGPHAAFFATRDQFKRSMPGRIVGVSKDSRGKPALRLALQTREQHIRREKATSNICTAQALLANMASMYVVYHGAKGLKNIAKRVAVLTQTLVNELKDLRYEIFNESYFDTISVKVVDASIIRTIAEAHKMNFYYVDKTTISISIDETTTQLDVLDIAGIFSAAKGIDTAVATFDNETNLENIPTSLTRTSSYLLHPVFNSHHSETEMMRYLKMLENKDLSLVHSMISLGSCTMKLNAASELIPVSWPEFSKIHPFAPADQTEGYQIIIDELEDMLCEITSFTACSLQPNSGAQGEYAVLLSIRAYHESRKEDHRNVILIPISAHGTNPASAVMAGFKVVVTKCDDAGNIDVNDRKEQV